jgi:hypothetical protein
MWAGDSIRVGMGYSLLVPLTAKYRFRRIKGSN